MAAETLAIRKEQDRLFLEAEKAEAARELERHIEQIEHQELQQAENESRRESLLAALALLADDESPREPDAAEPGSVLLSFRFAGGACASSRRFDRRFAGSTSARSVLDFVRKSEEYLSLLGLDRGAVLQLQDGGDEDDKQARVLLDWASRLPAATVAFPKVELSGCDDSTSIGELLQGADQGVVHVRVGE